VIRKNPQSWRANVAVGLQELEANRCDAALKHFETARPGVNVQFRAAWFTNYARALDCVGRDSEAEKAFLESLSVERMPSTLSQLGVFYGKKQQYQEALNVLNQAIELDPNFPLAYSNRGNVHARLGNCGSAVKDFQRALALMPSNTAAQRGLAYCREQQGR
jgi:tetratricopeptide (TPR) repeat protein